MEPQQHWLRGERKIFKFKYAVFAYIEAVWIGSSSILDFGRNKHHTTNTHHHELDRFDIHLFHVDSARIRRFHQCE